MPIIKKDVKKTGRGVKVLKQLLSAHKTAEEEHAAVVATIHTYTLNYVSLEKAPTITEDRLEFITAKFNTLPLGRLMNTDAIVRGLGPFPTLQHADQLITNTVVKVSNLFDEMFDDHYLRIHCELAHNLQCNLADVIVLENLLVNKWLSIGNDMPCIEEDCVTLDDLPFPPVVLLVVFILITPVPTLSIIFHSKLSTESPLLGDPPTFGRLLLTAAAKPKWPVLVNWVGSFSILFCLPIWFPLIQDSFAFHVPLNLVNEKCCVPLMIVLGQAGPREVVDSSKDKERDDLREGLLGLLNKPTAKKSTAKKGAKINAPTDSRKDASEINWWKINVSGKDRELAICDLSNLIMVPPRLVQGAIPTSPTKSQQQFSSKANSAVSVAKTACLRHNTVCLFMPFSVFQRAAEKEPIVENNRKAAVRSKGTKQSDKDDKKIGDIDNSNLLECQGSVFVDKTWDDNRVCDDETEEAEGVEEEELNCSIEGDGRQSNITESASFSSSRHYSMASSIGLSGDRRSVYDGRRSTDNNRRQRGGGRHTVEDEVVISVYIKRLSRYAFTAHRSSRRLHDRLQQKLREPFCCTRHIYEQLKYFCAYDRSLICEQCTREKYAGKGLVSLASHCSSEIQRLSEKEGELQRLVKSAHELAIALPCEKDSLHRHVDDEIDSLVSALNERRTSLHADIDNRKQIEIAAIEKEIAICEGERRTLDTAHLVLEGLARGDPTVVPVSDPMGGILRQTSTYDEFWSSADIRLHRPMGIHTWLRLLLPVEELHKSADRLDWSVPKQYLSCRAYPPPDAKCPILPSTTEVVSTVRKGKKYAIGNPAKWVKENQRSDDVELARTLADSLESVWGLVSSNTWRGSLKEMFTQHGSAIRTILTKNPNVGNKILKHELHFYNSFKELLQLALCTHIADGKFLSIKHEGKTTSLQLAAELKLLPESERRRLVSVDTLDASTSFSNFIKYIHEYHSIYIRDSPLLDDD